MQPFIYEQYTNDWHKPFPFDKTEIIEPHFEVNFKQRFKNQLPDIFYKTFKSYDTKPIKFIVYQNSLWRQFHAFDKDFIRSIPTSCDKQTIEAIKKLNLSSILDRRDQILKYCISK
ncbi:MAG: hypothetical protein LN588_03945 [Rickettsia endosymbiont of Bryobia graminum]|nr:hypothetical protein [Rickettsia endosymbiont of Bryobia graminum]